MSAAPPPYKATQTPSPAPPESGGDSRPLPPGWIREYDPNYGRAFWVDTKANPPRSIWTHPLHDPDYRRQSGRTSPYAPPSGPPPDQQDAQRLFHMGSSNRPQGSYQAGPSYQQGPYPGPQGPRPNQGYYGPQSQPYPPPQQQYYQQQAPQQQQYAMPPRKSGFGGGTALALGGGLLGGAVLGDMFEHHEQYQQQQAYDQGYDQGYNQGFDNGDQYDNGNFDQGNGGFDGGFDDGGGGGFDSGF